MVKKDCGTHRCANTIFRLMNHDGGACRDYEDGCQPQTDAEYMLVNDRCRRKVGGSEGFARLLSQGVCRGQGSSAVDEQRASARLVSLTSLQTRAIPAG